MRHLKQDLHVSQEIEHCSDSLKFCTITRVHNLFFALLLFYYYYHHYYFARVYMSFCTEDNINGKIVSTYKSSYRDDFCTINTITKKCRCYSAYINKAFQVDNTIVLVAWRWL